MKIGIVLSKTPAYSETFFISKIKGLINCGAEVKLFVQHKDDDFQLCPVFVAPKVYKRNLFKQFVASAQVCYKILKNLSQIKTFVKLEKESGRSKNQILKNIYGNAHIIGADLDWLHFGFATIALQSENVAKIINSKMGVSLRGFDMDVFPLKHKDPYALLWQKVDKIHTISNYMLARGYEEGLTKDKQNSIITPAIEFKSFEGFIKEQTNAPKMLTIGRLHWIKGFNYTLEALAILKNAGYKFRYTIIGEGKERDELLFTIHQLGLEDCVFLVGKKSKEDCITYLKESYMYLQYSISEGFCNAVLEAQAAKCLCIVSNGGALPENVLHNKTGIVVEKRNPEALADAIIYAFNLSNSKVDEMTTNAQERVKNQFTLKKQQEEFNDFFR